jgi:phenylacetate-CoA ligase
MRTAGRLLRFKIDKTPTDVDRVLIHLVRDACRSVPYYRTLVRDSGSEVARFAGVGDLTNLPQSTKETLVNSPHSGFLREGRNVERCVHTSTSGFTGLPITVNMSPLEAYYRRYTLLRTIRRYVALRFPVRIADVGPVILKSGRSVEQRLGLVNLLRIPGDGPLDEQRRALLRHRPSVIEGHPTSLKILAEALAGNELKLLQPRLVVCRGEALSQSARRLLEDAFRCLVMNLYNCEEVGNVAWECPDHLGRFHVNSDTCVVEVISDGTPNDEGHVTVTNLYNHTMPFIRYRLGDRAEFMDKDAKTCSCGVGGASIVGLSGREEDFIVLRNGRCLPPQVISMTIESALRLPSEPQHLSAGVLRFQVVQEEDYSVRVVVQWRGPVDERVLDRIRAAVSPIDPDLEWTVDSTDGLTLTSAGKFKRVLSRVPRGTRANTFCPIDLRQEVAAKRLPPSAAAT